MRFVLGIALLVLVSGCVAEPNSNDKDPGLRRVGGVRVGAWNETVDGPAPDTCDATRPAILHSYDGELLSDPVPLGIPCIMTTPWGGYEPSLGVTSSNTVFLYPAFEAPVEQAAAAEQFVGGIGVARSNDMGSQWERKFSEIGPANYHTHTADPFMYVDPYTDRVFIEDLAVPPFNCSNLSFSDDEGETWTQTLGGCLVWDHVSYGSGKPVTSTPSDYPTVLYRCAITYFATTVASEATGCQKSLTGGMTWEPPGEPAYFGDEQGNPYVPSTCHGAAHHVFVDHRGWVWLPRAWCDGNPWVSVSKDEGATWTQYRVSDKGMVGHDAGVAVDLAGTVYYLFPSPENRPMLSVSHDDGVTWSEPRDVAPPGIARASSVNLEAGAPGRIGITYGANLDNESVTGVHAVVVVGFAADTDRPIFQSVFANPPDRPIANGNCGGTCSGQGDFITGTLGPTGAPWMSIMDRDQLATATIFGAPSLWDDADPNGIYKD